MSVFRQKMYVSKKTSQEQKDVSSSGAAISHRRLASGRLKLIDFESDGALPEALTYGYEWVWVEYDADGWRHDALNLRKCVAPTPVVTKP